MRVRTRLQAESLELRSLLSTANPAALAGLNSMMATPAVMSGANPLAMASSPQGFTPAQIRAAYGFDGITGDGTGQTIAIVDAYSNQNLTLDLDTFDRQFGLTSTGQSIYGLYGASSNFLTQVNQSGGNSLPRANAGWALEQSLDVEWAHAIAPGAKILLVEANSGSLGDLLAAVDYARHQPGVSTVSMSWGSSEFANETAYDNIFTTPAGHNGVTFVAASGDDGGLFGPDWPAVSTNVLSVGGTTLSTQANGSYASETGWFNSGGGISAFEPEPTYQFSAQTTGARTTPDVAYNADPNTGFAVYDSTGFQGQSGWIQVGGTSAGAPQWAGLVALANQSLSKGTLDGASQTLPDLYSLASTPSASSFFHGVTTGNNFYYAATPGYNAVTGLGSPIASAIVQAAAGSSGVVASAPAVHAAQHAATVFVRARDIPNPVVNTPVLAAPVTVAQPTPVFVVIVTAVHTPAIPLPTPVAPVLHSTPLVTPSQVSPGQSMVSFSSYESERHPARSEREPRIIDPAEWSIEVQRPMRLPAYERLDSDSPLFNTPRLSPALWRALLSLDAVCEVEDSDAPMACEPQAPALMIIVEDQAASTAEAALAAALAVVIWGAWEWRLKNSERRRWLPNL
jgi:hypothetical protein